MKKVRMLKRHMGFREGAVLTTQAIFADSWVIAGIAEYVTAKKPKTVKVKNSSISGKDILDAQERAKKWRDK